MSSEFQWGLEQCPPPSVSINPGGSLPAGSGTFYLQGWNPAGVNLAGSIAVSWPENSLIQVAVPASAKPSGTHFDYFALSFSPDGSSENGYLVGLWKNYEEDQVTPRAESNIVISNALHLATNQEVTISALPINPIAGTTRRVTDAPQGPAYYTAYPWGHKIANGVSVLPSAIPGWVWVRSGAPNLSAFPVGGVSGIYGCGRKVTDLDESIRLTSVLFAPPKYDALLTANRPYIFLQFTNRYGSPIKKGTKLTLQPFINGIIEDSLLSEYLICNVMGYVDPETGLIDDTSGLNDGASMYGIGSDLPYSYGIGFWTLQKNLPVNHAVVVRVSPRFDLAQLGGRVLPGSRLSVLIQILPNAGRQSLEAKIFDTPQGGLIFKGLENGRILPGPPTTVVRGAVSGSLVKTYISGEQERTQIYGFTATNNQKISTTKDGIPINRGTSEIPDVEALIAIVSFSTGESTVAWSPVSLSLAGGIRVQASYPWVAGEWRIRQGYPYIGEMPSPGGPIYTRIYIKNSSNVTFKMPTKYVVMPGATQEWIVSSLDSASQVEPSLQLFGMFDPPSVTATPINGTIPAGSYQVGVAWEYDGTVATDIDHNPNSGCLPVMMLNLAEISETVLTLSSPTKIIQKILAFGG